MKSGTETDGFSFFPSVSLIIQHLKAMGQGEKMELILVYFSPLRNLVIVSSFPLLSSPKALYLSSLKC